MFPRLYPSTTPKTGFGTNGLGFISTCTKCNVIENIIDDDSGIYEVALELLTSDRLSRQIAPGAFIKVKPNPSDPPQLFEIYSVECNGDRITAQAQHIRYIAFNNALTESVTPTGRTPAQWWEWISDLFAVPCDFTFSSNIATSGVISIAKDRPVRLGEFLTGESGSMIKTFHGEFLFDNFEIKFLNRRGSDTQKCLRWGSNISSYTQSSDGTTMYTHLLPYAEVATKSTDKETLAPSVVYPLSNAAIELQGSGLTHRRVLLYDFTEQLRGFTLIKDATSLVPTNYADAVSLLNTAAAQYISVNSAALTAPSVNITVDVPAALESLSDLKLYDTLTVAYEPLRTTVQARVIRTEYDALEERYSKLELGTSKRTLSSLFSGTNIGGA